MLVKEIMTKKVITIEHNETVFEACNMYKNYKIGCLIVTDNGRCVGMITERDLIERTICARRDPEMTEVGEIMSTDIKTIHALDTLEKALGVMEENNIKKLTFNLKVSLNDSLKYLNILHSFLYFFSSFLKNVLKHSFYNILRKSCFF